jgi:hypothetical protein
MEITIKNIKEYKAESGRNAGKSQYIAKLVHQDIATISIAGLGSSSSVKQKTFYFRIETLDKPAAELLNTKLDLDLSQFDIQERAFTEDGDLPLDTDGNPICQEDGTPIMLKWITPKLA